MHRSRQIYIYIYITCIHPNHLKPKDLHRIKKIHQVKSTWMKSKFNFKPLQYHTLAFYSEPGRDFVALEQQELMHCAKRGDADALKDGAEHQMLQPGNLTVCP